MRRKVIIIGGGYGGLATANLFAKAGDEVIVIEKNQQLGGRAGQIEQDGFRFDTGPSWYLMPEVFQSYYNLFGINAQKELSLTRLDPGYKVFFDAAPPLTIAGNVAVDAATFESIETGAGKKLEAYVRESTRIYELSVNEILYNTYQSKSWFLHRNVLKALPQFSRMATRSLDAYISTQFHDQRLKQVLEYHSVFLGTSPYEAPAIYSLMSTLDFASGVYYPKQGIYSLVESLVRLGKKLGVTYRTNSPVQSIEIKDGTARGVHLSDGETISADIVISNADLHHTETQLIETHYQSYPEAYWKKRQPGPSALLISLGIKGLLPELTHHNLSFVDEWRENFEAIYDSHTIPERPSLYVCKPSHTDASTAPKGHENLFILVPLPAGLDLNATQRDTLITQSIAKVAELAKAPDLADRIVSQHIVEPATFAEQFNAWEYNALGGQSHLLSQSAFFRTRNQSKKVKNLYYVGAGTNPGIGLPMCLISAELVYKLVEGITSSGPLTEIKKGSV